MKRCIIGLIVLLLIFPGSLCLAQTDQPTIIEGIGSEEGPRMKSLSDALSNAGIHNTYYVSQGTAHEWLTWRRCLYQFAPMLFKN